MSILLVTYDLNKPGKDYSDVLKTIKSYSWAKLSESSYAVSTNLSPDQLFGKLSPFIDGNDTLLIVTLKRPYCGRASPEVVDWLAKYLE